MSSDHNIEQGTEFNSHVEEIIVTPPHNPQEERTSCIETTILGLFVATTTVTMAVVAAQICGEHDCSFI